MERKKLRLLLWDECNRACDGCCNKGFDLPNLPVCGSYKGYDLIMLTGGEPMLYPDRLKTVIGEIRGETDARIVLYTAKTDDADALIEIAGLLDGLTVTLHDPSDVKPFLAFDDRFARHRIYHAGTNRKDQTFRLNVFSEARIDPGEITAKWNVKDNIKWIIDCPLPAGEVLMRHAKP